MGLSISKLLSSLFGKKEMRILMVGLNGAGKTTSSAKLAKYLKSQGRAPLLIASDLTLHDTLFLRNLTSDRIRFSLEFRFEAGFEDIFAIRGLFQGRRGNRCDPAWRDDTLQFRYAGVDKIDRALTIQFSPAPDERLVKGAGYLIERWRRR